MTRLSYVLVVAACLTPTTTFAGTNDNAKIAGHLQTVPTGKGPSVCERAPYPPCNLGESNLMVQGDVGVGYDLYLLVLDGDPVAGVAGASFGIDYGASLSVTNWTLCATLNFPGGPQGVSWPDSGSGNVITWRTDLSCQSTVAQGDSSGGVTAVLGALYVYAYGDDTFEITPQYYVPNPDVVVAGCDAEAASLSYPAQTGLVAFGSDNGYDPCGEGEEAHFSSGSALVTISELSPPAGQFFADAIWSPSGDHLLLKDSHGAVYLSEAPFHSVGSPVVQGDIGEAVWSPTGDEFAFLEFRRSIHNPETRVKVYSLARSRLRTIAQSPGLRYRNLTWPESSILAAGDVRAPEASLVFFDVTTERVTHPERISRPVVWLRESDQNPFELWIADSNSIKRGIATQGRWWAPILSPSGDRVAVISDQDGITSRVYIISDEGVILEALRSDFNASDWDPSGRYLLGWVSSDDGHVVTSADLVVFDTSTSEFIFLTKTNDRIERRPVWSSPRRQIAYLDADNGSVIVAGVVRKGGGR